MSFSPRLYASNDDNDSHTQSSEYGLEAMDALVEYIFEISNFELEEFIWLVRPIGGPIKEIVMTVAERFRQQGLEEGMRMGMAKRWSQRILAVDVLDDVFTAVE